MLRAALTVAGIVLAGASQPMALHSSDFPASGVIPLPSMATDCGGKNRSPALTWSNAPSGTRSFAIVMHDADAPISGGFYHWVVYNLPAGTQRLAAGVKLAPDQLGDTSLGKAAYYGPCPPPGPAHHYTIAVYALDFARISSSAPLTGPQLEARIGGHALTHATLQGTASHN
ncbi:MAG: YbhB/YbcL family Raf kinase inhibitor-like protein [Candidatus Eremiobacteraeota bacterium]|nr:YbhB/YbcL family Raf kinase inhibitor-like protein [Candidatus Eremiobacteraeota bacterium]